MSCVLVTIQTRIFDVGRLTFAGPDRSDDVVLHAEYDGGHDDGRKGRFRNEGAVRHEESETEDDKEAGVDSTKGRLDSTGGVDCSPGEGACGGHGLDK